MKLYNIDGKYAEEVKITNTGKIYPHYKDFFRVCNISDEGWVEEFIPEKKDFQNWEVLCYKKHPTLKTDLFIISKTFGNKPIKLVIDEDGVKITKSKSFFNEIWSCL